MFNINDDLIQLYLLHGTFITMLKKLIQTDWVSKEISVTWHLVVVILFVVNVVFHGGRISVQPEREGQMRDVMLAEVNSGKEPETS